MKSMLSRSFAVLFVVLLSFLSMSIFTVNAGMLIPYPIEPNNDPPIITIETQTNQTYNTQNITLTFTITKPDTWTWSEGIVELTFDRINEISYFLDGKKEISYLRLENNYLDNGIDRLPKVSPYLVELINLSEGSHTLSVEVISEHDYKPTSDLYTPHSVKNKITTSNPVIFSIDTTPSPSPTSTPIPEPEVPTTSIIASIAVVLVGFGVFAYLVKKRTNK